MESLGHNELTLQCDGNLFREIQHSETELSLNLLRESEKFQMLFPQISTLKHRETHGCVVRTVATDALVL